MMQPNTNTAALAEEIKDAIRELSGNSFPDLLAAVDKLAAEAEDSRQACELAHEFARMAITADADAARAELSPATEQSGEAVAWTYWLAQEGVDGRKYGPYLSVEKPNQDDETLDVIEVRQLVYADTRPQPAPEAVQLVCDALIAIVAHSGNPGGMAEMLKPWRARAEEFTRNYGRQQPAPAVPEPMDRFVFHDDIKSLADGIQAGFVDGWNACRAKMLAAAPQPKEGAA